MDKQSLQYENGRIIKDLDIRASKDNHIHILSNFGEVGIDKSHYTLQNSGVEYKIIIKNITYLGWPHPLNKKRIQIQPILIKNENIDFLLGCYKRREECYLILFDIDKINITQSQNTSIHVNIQTFSRVTINSNQWVNSGGISVPYKIFSAQHLIQNNIFFRTEISQVDSNNNNDQYISYNGYKLSFKPDTNLLKFSHKYRKYVKISEENVYVIKLNQIDTITRKSILNYFGRFYKMQISIENGDLLIFSLDKSLLNILKKLYSNKNTYTIDELINKMKSEYNIVQIHSETLTLLKKFLYKKFLIGGNTPSYGLRENLKHKDLLQYNNIREFLRDKLKSNGLYNIYDFILDYDEYNFWSVFRGFETIYLELHSARPKFGFSPMDEKNILKTKYLIDFIVQAINTNQKIVLNRPDFFNPGLLSILKLNHILINNNLLPPLILNDAYTFTSNDDSVHLILYLFQDYKIIFSRDLITVGPSKTRTYFKNSNYIK